MNKKLNIINPATLDRALVLVREAGEGHEVSIKPITRRRSVNQHSLYWKYCTVIGNELGETSDEVHRRNKERHLLPILIRENLQGVVETLDAINTVIEGGLAPQAGTLHGLLVRHITTTTLSTKLMAEYMEQVEREAVSLGINLPRPEDLAA